MPHEITEFTESFIIRDPAGRGIAAVYFDDGDAVRRAARERIDKPEALKIARLIAALPEITEYLEGRKELLAGCTEGSEEEAELKAVAEMLDS